MSTVTNIVDDIKSDLTLNGSDYDNQIIRAIQTRLRGLRGRRFWFLEAYGSLTATSNSETIDIGAAYSDYSATKSIDLIADNARFYDKQGFDLLKFDKLRARYWSQATIQTGRPEACAVLNKTLYLSHKAQSAYTLQFTYYKQDATLPGAGGTSIWFDEGYDVIRSGAMYIFKRDAEGMLATEADYDMMVMAEKALSDQHTSNIVGESY